MKQMSLFDLMALPDKDSSSVINKARLSKKVSDIAPLDSSVLVEPAVEWVSYALAKLKSGDKGYYCLILPLEHPDDDVDFIRECFTSAGIDPYKPWAEQMDRLKNCHNTYGENEMRRYNFGIAGHIRNGYAIKPVCPFCGSEVELKVPLLGDKPLERVCAVEMSCTHTAVAGMIFLPDCCYAQQVFEIFGFEKNCT